MKKIVFLLCLILFNYSLKAQENELPAFVTDSLENYIIRGMTKWEIPGLSIAIVKNGKIQFMKGFGTTKAGGFEPVDENTLFMIGSITKTFTSTAISLLQSDGKLSIDDTRTEIPVTQLDNLAPAASMSSSAKDMATWLLAHLNNGKIDESQVIPGSAVQTIRRPHTIIGMDTRYKQLTHFSLYGLGLHIKDRKGIVVYSHAGGVPGFVSSWLFVPEENLGITILTNTDYNLFCSDLENEILDAFLGLPYQGYSNKSFEILKQYRLDTKNNRNRIRLSYLIRISVPDFHSFPESSFFRNQTITNFVINFIDNRMSGKNIQAIKS
jgi:CubicO group peptidase (beta-lactamase class C family)